MKFVIIALIRAWFRCRYHLSMMPRSRLLFSAAVAAAATAVSVWAYDVPLNTHKIDFWDTNQVNAGMITV